MSFAAPAASCPSCQAWTNAPTASASQSRTEPVQRVRIVLFYDGTFNNKFNTAARQRGGSARAGQASYANDVSNVARMSEKLVPAGGYRGKAYDVVIPIYIEGIGTTTGGDDSVKTGGAFGTGGTGVLEKVESGFSKALERLMKRPASIPFEFIHFDTFGFSRGAAAARNAVHRILNGRSKPMGRTIVNLPGARKKLTDAGRKVSDLKIRFVGLYDTVASYGWDHDNDTRELRLDSISAADQVVHLAAADEHRYNFRLTNTSSNRGGNSFELFLPGGHSDIGGGYNDGAVAHFVVWKDSVNRFASTAGLERRQANELAWLRGQGWFTGGGNRLTTTDVTGVINREFSIIGRQSTALNQYCFIPLNIMGRRASEQDLNFSNLNRVTGNELLGVQSGLRLYENARRHASSPFDWFHQTSSRYLADLPGLRSRHLHFTSYFKDLGDPTWVDDLLSPMRPNYVNGRRERVIQNG
ncbi:T6SS phospholipase effector Tle1-like catalytic domain-containing protein [Porphyrobacter sp. AAP60]|uniref:T6SS phospholipase effector Tle1-like catalytic domain-containing protein n=1 Tax=Porphyrobacter sp. AAP60 TaxID=1523423 RepID=UPI0006B9DEFD|nr:DUF2235 domain-containing protein [Porphyrobacter sp. AAP60]